MIMKKGLYLLIACGVGLLAYSCKNNQNPGDAVIVEEETIVMSDSLNPQMLNGEWGVIVLNGDSITPNENNAPFLGFSSDQKRIYGNSGCNALTGVLEWDSTKNGSITFGQIATTKMACPNDSVEQPMLNAMNNVDSFDVIACDSSMCIVGLYNGPDSLLMVIQKLPANTAGNSKAAPAAPMQKKK